MVCGAGSARGGTVEGGLMADAAAELATLDELHELDEDQAAGEGGAFIAAELGAARDVAMRTGVPVELEFGRYRLYQDPGGGWAAARAVGICETCQACGCGTQAQTIRIPALVINMALAPGG